MWPFDLERTMYSCDPPVLLRVKAKKVLNPNSVSNESDVSCEEYGLPKCLR